MPDIYLWPITDMTEGYVSGGRTDKELLKKCTRWIICIRTTMLRLLTMPMEMGVYG